MKTSSRSCTINHEPFDLGPKYFSTATHEPKKQDFEAAEDKYAFNQQSEFNDQDIVKIRDVRGKRSYESDGSARDDVEGDGTESNCPLSPNTDEKDELALELSSE